VEVNQTHLYIGIISHPPQSQTHLWISQPRKSTAHFCKSSSSKLFGYGAWLEKALQKNWPT